MQIKKTAVVTVFVSAIFVSANFMVAKAYEPLVRIPGLPADGPINLSQYVVGLYNFLLSIVGIVAVMMLIIGGMKYIAAAGNASVISDAKDTIWNAILGLLLALLSWVIVSTINPDVLYIKHPASSLIGNEFENDLGVCGVYDGTVCTCKDGTTPPAGDQPACETACEDTDACGLTKGSPCIKRGSSLSPLENSHGDLSCFCVDGEQVVLSAAAIVANAQCNEVCSDLSLAADVKYHGIKFVLRIGEDENSLVTVPESALEAGFPVTEDEPMVYDLSQTKDCKYGIVEIAIDFDNVLPFQAADEWCCELLNPGCNLFSWGQLCDMAGSDRLCDNNTEFPNKLPLSPMYMHTYSDPGPEHLWIGVSINDAPACSDDFKKEYEITVEEK